MGLLVLAARRWGWPVLAADVLAVIGAALLSYAANRAITFADDPQVRWVRRPAAFAATAALGLALDVAVLWIGWTTLPQGWSDLTRLLVAKALAVGVAALGRTSSYRAVLFEEVHRDLGQRVAAAPSPGGPRLSLVIPAYHERDRIGLTLERVRRELAELGPVGPDGTGGLEVVVVDDGSADGTDEAARAAGADQVVVQPENRGKGAAVRAGVRAARGRTIAFTDADLAYAPGQVLRLLAEVEGGWDVAVGSRKHTDTTTLVAARRLREVGGRVINGFTHLVLLGSYRDTQCGLKAFRGDVAKVVFGRCRVDGFAFDVEVFHLVERYRLSLVEVPVEVENSERSTVRVVRHGLRLVRDLFAVLRAGRRGDYDLTPAEAEVLQARAGTTSPGGAGVGD